jgi:DNA-nicking Smr family endonuclease
MSVAEKRAKLIANCVEKSLIYSEVVLGDCLTKGEKLEVIKGAINELLAMHEEIQDEAAAAAVMLASEYSERAE